MYNGIGLTTPRGSGTNGYVVRNLSTLRTHNSAQDRQDAWSVAPPKHREPDEGILEHERKRQVEVECLKMQLQLEDDEVPEETIEKKVQELREKLLANLSRTVPSGKLKASDTHGQAAAKKTELDKMARALGTRSNYVEGDAFDREKQDELRLQRQVDRAERDRKRDEDRARMTEHKAKWVAEKREQDRLRRREEDRQRRERDMRRRSASPIRSRDSLSYTKLARRRSPSESPPPRRRRSLTPEPFSHRSPTPPLRASGMSSPHRRHRSPSRSPPRRPRDSRDDNDRTTRGRHRSASTGSSMSVSTQSSRGSRD